MEWARLKALLEAAKRKAVLDQEQIERQKQIIAVLVASGSETTDARSQLRTLEEIQDGHLADMERILNALDRLPAPLPGQS